jgi:hypothetical protein
MALNAEFTGKKIVNFGKSKSEINSIDNTEIEASYPSSSVNYWL